MNDIGKDYFYGKYHDQILLCFSFNSRCPLQCKYCMIDQRWVKPTPYSESEISLDLIKKFEEIRHPFMASITGGEPTLVTSFKEYVSILTDMDYCTSVSVFTSLIQPLEWFKDLSEHQDRIDLEKLSFSASYHFEHRGKTNFVEKIKEIKKYGLKLGVEFMMGSASDEAYADLVELSKIGLHSLKIVELRDTDTYKYKLSAADVSRFYDCVREDSKELMQSQEWIPTLDKFDYIPIKKSNEFTTFVNNGKLEEHHSGLNFKGWDCHSLQFQVTANQQQLEFRSLCDETTLTLEDITKYSKIPHLIKCPKEQCSSFPMTYLKIRDKVTDK